MFKFTIKFNDNFQIILANIFFLLPNINSILFRLDYFKGARLLFVRSSFPEKIDEFHFFTSI